MDECSSSRASSRNIRNMQAERHGSSEKTGKDLHAFVMGGLLHECLEFVSVASRHDLNRPAGFLLDPGLFEALIDEPPGGLGAEFLVLAVEKFAEDENRFVGRVIDDEAGRGAEGEGPASA